MAKQTMWTQILAVVVATTAATIGLPETGFSDDAAATKVLTVSRSSTASAGDKFEYQILPFHQNNFKNRKKFEEWLDDLGAKGWSSIAHFPGLRPQDHQRVFMRRVGGSQLVIDYEIEAVKATPLTHSVEQ